MASVTDLSRSSARTVSTTRDAPIDPNAAAKKAVATAAIDRFVKPGMKLGVGTGSTMTFAIEALGQRLRSGLVTDLTAVSTSSKTSAQAAKEKITLVPLSTAGQLDLAIDGADEVQRTPQGFNLIKGMGGALLQEKLVANAAKTFVVVVDQSKLVQTLGSKSPLPVEVERSSVASALKQLEALGEGAKATVRPKEAGSTEPFITDNGNVIIDVKFANGIADPKALAQQLDGMAGVKAHGLFLGMTDHVLVGDSSGVTELTAPTGSDAASSFSSVSEAVTLGAVGGAPALQGAGAVSLFTSLSGLPDSLRNWVNTDLLPQAQAFDATLTVEAARASIASGQRSLVELDRSALPKTEDEAIAFLFDRLGLSAKEQETVRRGLAAVEAGAKLPSRAEPIGGHSSKYPETFRTQMAVTDPGLDHLAMTLADPRMLDGTFVHMEIIDRPSEHTAPYSNPGAKTIGAIRMLMGDDAPATVFFGRPNYMPSIKADVVDGMDAATAGLNFNLPTAANQLANAAKGLFERGVSEVKVTMDGLSPEEVRAFGTAVHAQAQPQEGQYVSAAFNLNAVLKDFALQPADAAPISGAPTAEQRALMLKGSLQSIDAAKAGGFKKVTVDSASMTPPSYPLIEYFGAENILDWAHHAHEVGLETYGSGGMRDYHFPLLQLVGLDGVGVGFSIHEAPDPKTPGNAGRLLPEKVLSALEARNQAERAPVGRASVLLRMLDEKKSDGSLSAEHERLRAEVHAFLKTTARLIDVTLDALKAERDQAMAKAGALSDPAAKKSAQDAARKQFEDGFKQLISSALNEPAAVARATALLEQGASLEVQA